MHASWASCITHDQVHCVHSRWGNVQNAVETLGSKVVLSVCTEQSMPWAAAAACTVYCRFDCALCNAHKRSSTAYTVQRRLDWALVQRP